MYYHRVTDIGTMIRSIIILLLLSATKHTATATSGIYCKPSGYFISNQGNCSFYCYDSNEYIPKSLLSFSTIIQECENVNNAAELGYCSSVNDLLWTDDCSCPYCKCLIQDVSGTVNMYEKLTVNKYDEPELIKSCINCICDTPKDYPNFIELVYQCDTLKTAAHSDSEYEFNDFACNYDRYDIGDGWFGNIECNKWCYSNGDGTVECNTGYSAIIASSNDGLVGSFYDEFADELADCLHEPDRMFTNQVGPTCSAVVCDCGTHSIDEQWYTEINFDESRNEYMTLCLKCTCMSDPDGNYAQCSALWQPDVFPLYPSELGSCPGNTTKLPCHQQRNSESNGIVNLTVSKLNNDPVFDEIMMDYPSTWCSWSYQDGNDAEWRYDQIYCGIYGSNNNCMYAEWTKTTILDCNGNNKTETIKSYKYCCNTDNCNFIDIDISTCTENTRWSEMSQINQDCKDSKNAYFMKDNDCWLYEDETITSDAVSELYKRTNCECEKLSKMYEDADDDWKDWIIHYAKGVMHKKHALECDLLNGNVTTIAPTISTMTTATTSYTSDIDRITSELQCGDVIEGNYNNEAITFTIIMEYGRDITIVGLLSNQNVIPQSIEIFNSNDELIGFDGNNITDEDKRRNGEIILRVNIGTYTVVLKGVDNMFTDYYISITCDTYSASQSSTTVDIEDGSDYITVYVVGLFILFIIFAK